MVIKKIEIEKFRSFKNASFDLGKRITVIAGRNATQKTTVLGMIGQPFTISKTHPMYGCKTVDGYNFRSQFKEKFKISPEHDKIGEHKWKLYLNNRICEKDYFSIGSIARTQKGEKKTLRFWNSESREKGAGYIQLPVYFLSLSRLFPIGEITKTQPMKIELTPDELDYCIQNYRTILCIQSIGNNPSVGLEKGGPSKTFAGVSDSDHDIFTNSAGESNITKIILAVLSFKRLKEQFGKEYKGGLLLIDEIDATLYGFSQKKLIDYLWEAAKEFDIQIVFTTHSPIVLKHVHKYHRKERQNKGMNLPLSAYDSSIVYLEPCYDKEGKRTIMSRNITSSDELNAILNDINLAIPTNGAKLNIYCEDEKAICFLQYMLLKELGINLDLFMNFIDIDLGWPCYVQLRKKEIPEFCNNIVVLDGDVPHMPEYKAKANTIEQFNNFMFLPLAIEKDIFDLLKNHEEFLKFQSAYSIDSRFNYDVCFIEWPLETIKYRTVQLKHWFETTAKVLGNQEILFDFWCRENQNKVKEFIQQFVSIFNTLAEELEVDTLPSSVLKNEVEV